MGYYGYGYDSYGYSAGVSVFTIFVIIMFVVALVGSFFVFFKFVAQPEGTQVKQVGGMGFVERLLRFKQLIVADVMRWFYIFSALLVALEGIVTTIYLITLVGTSALFLLFAIVNIGIVLLIELAVRVAYELRMLTVLIANDTSGIHSILANHYGDTGTPVAAFGGFGAGGTPEQQAQPEPAPSQTNQAPAQASGAWTCPTCGCADNQGSFCKQCGAPRA